MTFTGLLFFNHSLFAQQKKSAAKRPDSIVVLADDMGFSDIGCFGGEFIFKQRPNSNTGVSFEYINSIGSAAKIQ